MQTDNTPNRSTPRGIGPDELADIPSAYKVLTFDCENEDGAKFDIFPLVKSFTITEELFSPVTVLTINLRDNINFFEDFALSGQEKIYLSLARNNKKERKSRKIDLTFLVKEYPNYQKSVLNPNIQEYSIVAISEFGYASMLQKISRSVKGNPVDMISNIFKKDLDVDVDIQSSCVSVFDGIINVQSPLKAIEWLRAKAFDSSGSPFFVYGNISQPKLIIKSLSDLWSNRNEIFRSYEYRQFVVNTIGSPDFYAENSIRILDMRSNIKLDKLTQSTAGAFASKTNVTDISTKSFYESIFDYSKDSLVSTNTLSDKKKFSFKNSVVFKSGSLGKKALTDLWNASVSNISTNSNANFRGNQNSSSGPIQENLARGKSFYANLDAFSHQVQVYGDFEFNPGKKIRIAIPKSLDPRSQENDPISELDNSMSGDYIVAVVAHSFIDGVYTCKSKIIKDV